MINEKMKAFVRTSSTDMEVKLQEVPRPKFQKNEVLIEVEAFGVGIHDRYFIPQDVSFPYVIGTEGAGIIRDKGNEVRNFNVGDRMIFTTILQPGGGSWADYAVAKEDVLIALPDRLTFEQGAALPIAGTTALECIRELNLASGELLFVAGGSGAIGSLVIQLAATQNVRVAASASERNHDYMKSLGAEFTVDYHDPEWVTKVREWAPEGVNAALAIQPGTGAMSIKTVKDRGLLLTVSGDNALVPTERNIEVRQMMHQADTQTKMKTLLKDIAEGKIKLTISHAYPFESALDALAQTETRHGRGKLVVIKEK